MGLLKLPKYVELPGGVAPVIGCKPGDIAPLVILTNFRDHVRRSEALLDEVTFKTDAGWAGLHHERPLSRAARHGELGRHRRWPDQQYELNQ